MNGKIFMKHLKKIMILILLLSFIFTSVLTACGDGSDKTPNDSNNSNNNTNATEEPATDILDNN
jgi:hypothetical protein